jgi:hypothetical protein
MFIFAVLIWDAEKDRAVSVALEYAKHAGRGDRWRLAHAAKIFPPERYAGAHEAMQDARTG